MLLRAILTFLLAIVCIQTGFADTSKAEHFELPLNDETAISITKFGNTGDRILWIPSEHGINKENHYDLLRSLAALQHEVWLAEIHESYFIPAGRSSYTKIPVDDMARLIENSLPEDERKLFIVSTGRAAVLSSLALNRWLATTGNSNRQRDKFAGIIMIHPNFQADTPHPGTAMEYLALVDSIQLPIFVIQPKKSNKYWYLNGLVSRLTAGGSEVYTKIIEQASDGYHVRPDRSDTEKQMAKTLPADIARATQLLAQTKVIAKKQPAKSETWQVSTIAESLQAFPGNVSAPELELQDMGGNKHRLKDYRGKVVVLNFWATWCPPCVEEIPSLGHLQQAFSKDDLVVLSVDIGENKNDVQAFLQQVPAAFPVLLNPDGSTVKQWNIIAFPTTFIIDAHGSIRLTYFGGLEWDKPDIVEQLRELVKH